MEVTYIFVAQVGDRNFVHPCLTKYEGCWGCVVITMALELLVLWESVIR